MKILFVMTCFQFLDKTMNLVKDDQNEVPVHPSPNYARYGRRMLTCSPGASLNTRRNVRLAPVQTPTSNGPSCPPVTPGVSTR